MFLESLFLRNFRNFEKAQIFFSPRINLIHGANGQGKTNLLEAIALLSTGRSFRTAHLNDLIRMGESYFYLEAQFVKEGISQSLKIYFDGKQRKIQYNATNYTSFSNLLGHLPLVLYAPDDVTLVNGSPAARRSFIDLQLAQVDPLYVHHVTRYHKSMKQRNALLKQKSEVAIGPWEETMASAAGYIVQKREQAAFVLSPIVDQLMQELSLGQDRLDIQYQPFHPLEQMGQDIPAYLLSRYPKMRPKEMHFGMTLIGPHRDDLGIQINQKLAKSFASEGQKRCCIAALHLAEWQFLQSLSGAAPLFGVDDFGVHLDEARTGFLQQQLGKLGQVFLTSPAFLDGAFTEKTAYFTVSKGDVLGS